jgi:AcrR family transcriptional regulator
MSLFGGVTAADVRGEGVRGGRGRLSREQVQEGQRARIMRAMVGVVAEGGLADASIARVIARAGVSRLTFYELFGNFDGCFLAVLDAAKRRTTVLVSEAFEQGATWPERAVGGLAALLGFLDSDPQLARVCVVEALAAGPAALELRARELEVLKHMVDAAAGQAPGDRHTSMLGAEMVVASVAGILHARVVSGEAPPFLDLLAPLVEMVLAPSLDAQTVAGAVEQARLRAQELGEERSSQLPRPTADVAIPRALTNPSAHRRRECLLYLCERPGASNREVGKGIGVSHSGQVSKLLEGLAQRGLILKRRGRAGHANAWSPTPHGEQVARALQEDGMAVSVGSRCYRI